MSTTWPSRRTVLALLSAPWAAARGAAPGKFPNRPVRVVVPYSVGIGPDVVARSVAERLSLRWNETVLVDNRPGASGILAFADVRRTPADGHTIFLADTATLAVNPLLHKNLPYDPAKDLVPLSLLFRATFLLWVGGGSPLHSVAELQQAARSEPGRISYGSLGNGHASQVAVETYARAAGLQLLHVPFKDAGALFSSVASGEVDFTAFSMNSVFGLMTSGKLRPLAVAARERLPLFPEIPTLVQAGGPPVEMHPWAALVTVAGTSAPVLHALQQDIAAVLASPEVRSRAETAGFEITPSTPQAVLDLVQADIAQVRPLIAEGRLTQV
ncbi:MAG: tripartite tricarboxylate transporter substrate binding protein [Rubrivivax sp.]